MTKKQYQIILAALPLLFLACDKLLPPAGSGVDIPVKIRAVKVAGGAQNETLTRADGGSKRRMAGEPIIQNLGGEMLAKITVEEEVEALRADPAPQNLGSNVKFRVMAVGSDDKVYSYADYTMGSNTIARDVGSPELHVKTGSSYYFVCISRNNATLPDHPKTGDDLLTKTVEITAGSNDLLYQKTEPEKIASSGDVNLSFTGLEYQLVKAKLKLDAGTGKTIAAVGSISLDAATSGDFNLKEGKFSRFYGSAVFPEWESFNQQTVTSDEFIFLPKAEGYTFTIPVNALTLGSAVTLPSVARSVSVSAAKFEKGKSYTLTVTLKALATSQKFAGSNIYWDDANSRLTFDPHGSHTHAHYQGVYFQWGSLVGISPVGVYSDDAGSGTVLYWPDTIANRTWKKITGGYAYSAIPSWYGKENMTPTGEDAHTLLAYEDFTHYKGDICNYINSSYRMPTLTELSSFASSYSTFTNSGDTDIGIGDDAKAGRYEFKSDNYVALGGLVFPASGYRGGGVGTLGSVGSGGRYWSGSAFNDSDKAYYLYFASGSSAASTNDYYRDYARSVRCVLQDD